MHDTPFFSGSKIASTRSEKLAADLRAREYLNEQQTDEERRRADVQRQKDEMARESAQRQQAELDRARRHEELARLIGQVQMDDVELDGLDVDLDNASEPDL